MHFKYTREIVTYLCIYIYKHSLLSSFPPPSLPPSFPSFLPSFLPSVLFLSTENQITARKLTDVPVGMSFGNLLFGHVYLLSVKSVDGVSPSPKRA